MIKSLVDYPSIKKLANALWRRDTKSHGAAVMVGAGLSRCSALHADVSKKMPLWPDLGKRLSDELFGEGNRGFEFVDPLRLAEQYKAYFGQAALNDLIKAEVQDAAWQPGKLHGELLQLPWTDVLTTNWDTLLERKASEMHSPIYEVVLKQADLSSGSSPRIIKLHGTVGVSENLVFTQEDYRTYPEKQAAFVNVARQIFIENELCLLGFSGDDPNFLQWAGWVRDHLALHARKIYLIGALNLVPAVRKYLDSLNVAPIDLWDAVKNIEDIGDKHHRAIELFLAELKSLEPLPPYRWKLVSKPIAQTSSDDFVRFHQDHGFAASLLSKHVDVLRAEREAYPGWLICPAGLRRRVGSGIEFLGATPDNVRMLSHSDKECLLYEIAWRCELAIQPMQPWLVKELSDLANASSLIKISKRQQLEIALWLMKVARRNDDEVEFEHWAGMLQRQLHNLPDCSAEIAYQRALMARDRLDYGALEKFVEGVEGVDAIWGVRRAALLASLKQFSKGEEILTRSFRLLMDAARRTPDSIYVLSRLAWVYWLQRMIFWHEELKLPKNIEDKISEFLCDSRDELDSVMEAIAKHREKYLRSRAGVEPSFEVGYYRENSSGDASRVDVDSLLTLRYLMEEVGIPLRWNIMVMFSGFIEKLTLSGCMDLGVNGLVCIIQGSSSLPSPAFDGAFSRLVIAGLPSEDVLCLSQAVLRAIGYWREKFGEGSNVARRWIVDDLGVLIEALSRLSVRLSQSEAAHVVKFAVDLGRDALSDDVDLYVCLDHLIKYSLSSLSSNEKSKLLPDILDFPLPHEKSGGVVRRVRDWPNPVMYGVKRNFDDSKTNARIYELVRCAKSGNASFFAALQRLLPLIESEQLSRDEFDLLACNMWSSVDLNAMVSHIITFRVGALVAPVEKIDDLRKKVCVVIFDAIDEYFFKWERLVGLANVAVAKKGLNVFPSEAEAVKCFDRIMVWRPKVDANDILGIVANREKEIAQALGKR